MAIYGEANDAMARQFGFSKGQELIGRPVGELLPQSDPKNVETITQLVRQRFLWKNWVTHEKTVDGSTVVYLNNIVPSIRDGNLLHTWGSSLDITDLFDAQEKLKRSQEELSKQKMALEKKNIALKELIAHIELEKKGLKDRIQANVEHVILPSLDKISLNTGDRELVEQHRMAILDLTSSFGLKVTDKKMKLTPREIEVCKLVKNGLTNKEISQLLCIALHTFEKHRRTARNKLGLANKGINLRTYLNSI
jgi:PAS domain S-box-containing protein